MSEASLASGSAYRAPANGALRGEPDSRISGALEGPRPGKPTTAGTGAKIGVVNTQPALRASGQTRGRGEAGPPWVRSVALRANKTGMMMRVSLLDGWGPRAGRLALCVVAVVVGLWGRVRGPCVEMSHTRLSPAGDFLGEFPRKVKEEGAGNREERKGVSPRDTGQGVKMGWPEGLILQLQTL